MAAVSVLGPGGYPKAPYGSFAGKVAASTGSKVYTQTFSVLGPGGYPRPPYGAFGGKTPTPPTTGEVRNYPFICNVATLMGR